MCPARAKSPRTQDVRAQLAHPAFGSFENFHARERSNAATLHQTHCANTAGKILTAKRLIADVAKATRSVRSRIGAKLCSMVGYDLVTDLVLISLHKRVFSVALAA